MFESQSPSGFGSKYSADVFWEAAVLCKDCMRLIYCDTHIEQGIFLIDTYSTSKEGHLLCHHLAIISKRLLSPEPTSAKVLLGSDCLMVPPETPGENLDSVDVLVRRKSFYLTTVVNSGSLQRGRRHGDGRARPGGRGAGRPPSCPPPVSGWPTRGWLCGVWRSRVPRPPASVVVAPGARARCRKLDSRDTAARDPPRPPPPGRSPQPCSADEDKPFLVAAAASALSHQQFPERPAWIMVVDHCLVTLLPHVQNLSHYICALTKYASIVPAENKAAKIFHEVQNLFHTAQL
ncbi:uncharacterized protein AAGF69_008331 [Amazona ochrocephala]